MEPDEGDYKWGITTSQSYFPKDNTKDFDCDDVIVDWLTQYSENKDATYVRGFLGRMLFAGDDGVKKVRVLSGGEKVRVMLSKLMISGANVLVIDEPYRPFGHGKYYRAEYRTGKIPGRAAILFQRSSGSSDHCQPDYGNCKR